MNSRSTSKTSRTAPYPAPITRAHEISAEIPRYPLWVNTTISMAGA